jgi:hypothetical protein
MLAEDPCVAVDLPRVKRKKVEVLSVDECRKFLEVAEKSEWLPLLTLVLTTGMRPSGYLASSGPTSTDSAEQRASAERFRFRVLNGHSTIPSESAAGEL